MFISYLDSFLRGGLIPFPSRALSGYEGRGLERVKNAPSNGSYIKAVKGFAGEIELL